MCSLALKLYKSPCAQTVQVTAHTSLSHKTQTVKVAGSTSPCGPQSRSIKQGPVLVRLGIGDLVDHEADTALGNDIRDAVADLDGHHSIGCGDSKHREEVHYRVGAPTYHRHHLRKLDF